MVEIEMLPIHFQGLSPAHLVHEPFTATTVIPIEIYGTIYWTYHIWLLRHLSFCHILWNP